MNSTAELLDRVVADLDRVLSADALGGLSDADRMDVLRVAGDAFRRVEAVVVESVAAAGSGFPHRFGCRSQNELLQRTLRVDAQGAGRVVKAADLVHRETELTSGAPLPARWPALREALLDGVIGIGGLLAATGPIEQARGRIGAAERLLADAALAEQARGYELVDDDDDDADAWVPEPVEGPEDPWVPEPVEGPEDPWVPEPVEGPDSADGPDAAPPATPEDLKQYAQLMALYLDPDGSAPSESESSQGRSFTVGRLKNGSYPCRGNLLPEVYAQLQLIFDAQLNPKTAGPPDLGVKFRPSDEMDEGEEDPFNSDPRNVIDTRTRAQKQHDALAAALGIAARHDEMPSLGGAAPTLVVHVDAKDFAAHADAAFGPAASGAASGGDAFGATASADGPGSAASPATGAATDPSAWPLTGWATIPGVDAPVSASVAAHTACTGTIQRVLFDEGRIVGISVTDRVFTVYQRRAIIARDKECVIPGCHVPASWCELHHVVEHARGGPTHTDNGVAVCWFHHRTLDRSGWEIRMVNGIPQIRGPAWWDRHQQWRTPRLSLPSFVPT